MIGLLVGLASCTRGSWLSSFWKALVLLSEAGAEVHRAGSRGRKGDGKWGREEALLWPLSLVWASDTSQALCYGPNPTPGRSWRRVLGGTVVGYSPSLLPTSRAAGDRPCGSSISSLLREPLLWLITTGNTQEGSSERCGCHAKLTDFTQLRLTSELRPGGWAEVRRMEGRRCSHGRRNHVKK